MSKIKEQEIKDAIKSVQFDDDTTELTFIMNKARMNAIKKWEPLFRQDLFSDIFGFNPDSFIKYIKSNISDIVSYKSYGSSPTAYKYEHGRKNLDSGMDILLFIRLEVIKKKKSMFFPNEIHIPGIQHIRFEFVELDLLTMGGSDGIFDLDKITYDATDEVKKCISELIFELFLHIIEMEMSNQVELSPLNFVKFDMDSFESYHTFADEILENADEVLDDDAPYSTDEIVEMVLTPGYLDSIVPEESKLPNEFNIAVDNLLDELSM